MSLTSLAYVSTASWKLRAAELEALLLDAREVNQRERVTGALLYHDGSIFQYIEGPAEGLNLVYERIKRSSKHKDIVTFMHHPIERRVFSGWHMGFAEAPGTLIQQLANSEWKETVSSLPECESPSKGLALLLSFWSRTQIGRNRHAP